MTCCLPIDCACDITSVWEENIYKLRHVMNESVVDNITRLKFSNFQIKHVSKIQNVGGEELSKICRRNKI